jgi:hypothetical protein
MAPGSGTATLTINTDVTTPPGTYPITIRAASGNIYHDATVNLVVQVLPTFTLSAPASVKTSPGVPVSIPVTSAIFNGYNSRVSVLADNLPSGVTVNYGPSSDIAAPGSGSATLGFGVAGTVPPGTYPITITAYDKYYRYHSVIVNLVVSNTLFSDGFEGAGWSTTNNGVLIFFDSTISFDFVTDVGPHSGSKFVNFLYLNRDVTEARIYRTDEFLIPDTARTVTLKYWIYHASNALFSPTYNPTFQPQIKTGVQGWVSVGNAVARYDGTSGWTQVNVDLGAYKGHTVNLGFLGVGNDSCVPGVIIDDVS